MDIRTVREIIQYGPMTTVPLMPDFVRGVINLRGAVVPVIDLHARFGRAGRPGRQEDLHRHLRRACATASASSSACWSTPSARSSTSPPARSSRRRTSAPRCGATSSAAWARSATASSSSSSPTARFDVDEMAALCEAGPARLAA